LRVYSDNLWGYVSEKEDITLASLAFTTTGQPLTILASSLKMPSFYDGGSGAGSSRLLLYRDTTLVSEGEYGDWGLGALDRQLIARDTPAAGTYTYYLKFRVGMRNSGTSSLVYTGNNQAGYCRNSTILILETKK
jgi:hypothetical protein